MRNKLKNEEISTLCYELGLLTAAGVTPEEGVRLLLLDSAGEGEKELLGAILAPLEQGEPLSAAIAATERFPDDMVKMLEAGEVGGSIDSTLHSLAEYYRQEAELERGLRRAVLYPAVMAAVAVAVLLVITIKVVPAFGEVFSALGAGLSTSAQLFLSAATICGYVALGIGGVLLIALACAGIAWRRGGYETMIKIFDRLFFRGNLALETARSRFASVMAMLTSSGVDPLEAMERAAASTANEKFIERAKHAASMCAQGETVAAACARSGALGQMESGLVAAGSRAGSQDKAFEEASRRSHERAEEMTERMSGRVEPIMVVFLAVVVGFELLAVMLPLLGMMSAIG